MAEIHFSDQYEEYVDGSSDIGANVCAIGDLLKPSF